MPKQKIEVNEDLNVSIGAILKSAISGDSSPPEATEETKLSGLRQSSISTKTNYPQDSDIKKIISKSGKISIQHQRSGRGGKTVTLVNISGGDNLNLEFLLKDLKKSLGCGGQLEEGKIVLHGEIASRVSEWFVKMGAKTVKSV